MESAILVEDLTKNYGEITAVDRVNFKVKSGEIFGFLGPNGAGKTTTIRMLTGVIKPSSGIATIMGYNILREPLKAKQTISVVPEMGYWGKIIASFSPLTYFTDLVNYCTQNDSYYSIHGDFIALIAFAILFLVLSVKIHSRTLPQRI